MVVWIMLCFCLNKSPSDYSGWSQLPFPNLARRSTEVHGVGWRNFSQRIDLMLLQEIFQHHFLIIIIKIIEKKNLPAGGTPETHTLRKRKQTVASEKAISWPDQFEKLLAYLQSFFFWSKVTENVVLSQLSAYLNANNLCPTSQSAYWPWHSTETSLLNMINDILHAPDNGDVNVVTLLDLSAAFDTIDHNIFCQRLEHLYGISSTPLNWFRTYLSNRTQTVTINNKLSSQPCSTLAFHKALFWNLFYSFCTQNLWLHSFDDSPFLTSLSQMTSSCTILAVQIK